MDTKKIKDGAIASFYVVAALGVAVFAINYGVTDWEAVSEDFSESMDSVVDFSICTIDYSGLHYEGPCVFDAEIYDFMREAFLNASVCEPRLVQEDII